MPNHGVLNFLRKLKFVQDSLGHLAPRTSERSGQNFENFQKFFRSGEAYKSRDPQT